MNKNKCRAARRLFFTNLQLILRVMNVMFTSYYQETFIKYTRKPINLSTICVLSLKQLHINVCIYWFSGFFLPQDNIWDIDLQVSWYLLSNGYMRYLTLFKMYLCPACYVLYSEIVNLKYVKSNMRSALLYPGPILQIKTVETCNDSTNLMVIIQCVPYVTNSIIPQNIIVWHD